MLQLANSPRATDDMTAAMIFRGWGGGESQSKVVMSASLKVGCEDETTCTWTEKNK